MTITPSSASPADASTASASNSRAIVFFDGVCGLCNTTVDFIVRHDRYQRLACAPLQGSTAQRYLTPAIREELNTLVLRLPDGQQYQRSAAVVRILWRLGGVWKLAAAALWLVPLPLRNLGYRLVAKWRYRLFGHRETCRLPTPEDADRLLT